MLETISDAVAFAEKMLTDEDQQTVRMDELDQFVRHLRPSDLHHEPNGNLVEGATRLAGLLSELGARENAQEVVRRTLQHMELVEAEQPVFPSSAWNLMALQLAAHGELNEARLVLTRALDRARRPSATPEDSMQAAVVLTNLSVISSRSGNAEFAERWAERALEALRESPRHPESGRLRIALASVLVSIARERADLERLDAAATELAIWTRRMAKRAEGRPEVLSALATLADAKLFMAHATGSQEDMETALGVLEHVAQKTLLRFGAQSPLALSVRANLAVARFELAQASFAEDADPSMKAARIKTAVDSLDSVVQLTVAALGDRHPQSVSAVDNLATAQNEALAEVGLRENFSRFYGPRDNERRNFAKWDAISREKHRIRIIAFGGASYFMGPLERYKAAIEESLAQGVKVEVIISNPWNSIASYFLVSDSAEKGSRRKRENGPAEALRKIEHGDYAQTFTPVIDSYRRLRDRYGNRIQLRIAPMDIPGTSLLTSEVGFFEPYMTADPRHRTRRPLKTFEIEFKQISHFHKLDNTAFDEFWNISNTVEEYEAAEEEFKALLRRRLEILSATMSGRSR